MNKSNSICFAVRRALVGSVLSTAVLIAGPVYSQTGPEINEDGLEEVVVTGSRIARPEVESSTPVLIISAAQLQQQGVQNLADVLAKIPSIGTPTYSRANSNFASTGNGVSTINLRNLEDKRTLVLINGRRVVSGIGGSTTVDLNNIPADLIESVQLVTGGASAVYGSEAVAGVVNFVMKKDFQGISARVQQGVSAQGGNNRTLASIAGGTDLGSIAHIQLNYQYDKDRGLFSRDRNISAVDKPFKSGFPPQGRFFSENSSDWTYDTNNQLIEYRGSAIDGYNRNGDRYISVPVQRHLLSGMLSLNFTDTFGSFVEGTYSKYKTNSGLEAFATDNSDARLPDGTILAGLTLDNPFIPAAIRQEMVDAGDTELGFLKRLKGIFDRSNETDRTFYRVAAGFTGTMFDNWNWETSFQQSQTRDETASGSALRDRYYYALDVVTNTANGQPWCRDVAARAAGCSPFNPFGYNSVSTAAINYITKNGAIKDTYDVKIRQQVASASVTAPLWALPAGDMQLAAGLESRKETSSEVFGLETQLGNTMGNALSNTVGEYTVKEAFLETVVPLLKDAAWAESWDAEAAIRVGDYSSVGNVLNWKLGSTWAPTSNIRFRAVYASAARAPNIGELFSGANQTFPAGLTDPCDGVTATTVGAVASYCRSIPGIAQQIQANGAFVYDENQDTQSIEGTDGSNPNLDAEVAKTWTVGLVFTPEYAPNFNMTVDWYRINITDAITLQPRQQTIDACVNSLGASSLCSLIVRELPNTPRPRTPGTVFQVNSIPVNAAEIATSGIDIGLHYRIPTLPNGGKLDMGLQYSYLDYLDLQTSALEPVEHEKGQLSGDGRLGAGFPHRANASFTYEIGPITATWRLNYLSHIQDTLDQNDPQVDPEENNIDSYLYHDMQVRYSMGKDGQYSVYVGGDNLFNKLPPLIGQNAASNITGTETAADAYDTIGAFFYAGVTARF